MVHFDLDDNLGNILPVLMEQPGRVHVQYTPGCACWVENYCVSDGPGRCHYVSILESLDGQPLLYATGLRINGYLVERGTWSRGGDVIDSVKQLDTR
jgi:hypothetical protein